MTTPLDLILLPLNRQNDRDLAELPGLHAASPPRRAARGRSMDNLVLHLALEGTAPLSPKGYQKLVEHLVATYYKIPGSATTAMRMVSTWLNDYLIERNLRGASRSMQSIGLLTLAVFRSTRLYLAQCGPTHTFLIQADGFKHFYESDLSGRGLGLAKAANVRYHQMLLAPADLVLISANPPTIWTPKLLNGVRGMSLDRIHLRLIHQVGPELQAALVQVETGAGKVRVLQPEAVDTDRKPARVIGETQETTLTKDGTGLLSVTPPRQVSPVPETATSAEISIAEEAEVEEAKKVNDSHKVVSQLSDVKVSQPEDGEIIETKPHRERIVGPAMVKIGQAIGETVRQSLHATGQLVRRMLPDETLLSIPTSVMAFIAFAVPIVVVAIAATVYFQRGQVSLYEEYYLQARYAAEQASQLSTPAEQSEGWNTVLSYLDQAEAYQITDDSRTMRTYAQTVIDNLDYVVRLPFQPALVDKLPQDAIIIRIVATDGDRELYMLNGTDGHVIRSTRTERGYEVDPDFICEPVPKPLIVGELVDIVPLPLGDPNNATIMGMDTNGNLMECLPGGKPPLTLQMPPPDMNWGSPIAFEMTASGLYVLDPITNAVWIFWLNDEFTERPTLFFDDQIPPMGDVIDLALNRDDLYLLHNDGHLTTCTFGYPTRCEDPAVINDVRDGRSSGLTIDDAVFREVQFAPPPDPSLFLLEPETLSIYHFSVRLSYQRQYRPQNMVLEGPATAFAITQNRQVFLATGNQVYYAPLP